MSPPPGRGARPLAATLKLAVLIVVLLSINHLVSQITDHIDFDIRPSNEGMVHRAIMTLAVLYALALCVPFVPGVEIALAMIALIGPKIVFLLYVSTIAGMLLAFGICLRN